MKNKLTIVFLMTLILFLQQAPTAQADSENNNLENAPELTWTKDLDSGYISTSPLIAGGMVVVKSPEGLTAYTQSDGTEKWKFDFTSVIQFEMGSILLHAANDSPEIVITGWSTGEITAHRLYDGMVHWSTNTTAPAYGIQGELVLFQDEILVPVETGAISLNPFTGQENWNISFPDQARGYRHSITAWSLDNTTWYATGDEKGRMTIWNSTSPKETETFDFQIANGKIRSNIIQINANDLLIPIQSTEGSILIHWKETSQNTYHSFTGSFGIISTDDENLIIPTTHNTTWWKIGNEIQFRSVITEEPVTGKVQYLDNEMFALPINTNQGRIEVYQITANDSEIILQWSWTPGVRNYMTSGLSYGNDFNAFAISNDAGRIEVGVIDVQKANSDLANSGNILAKWQSEELFSPLDFTTDSENSGSKSHYVMIVAGILLGLFAWLRLTPERKQQIPFACAATMILIGFVIAIPGIQNSVNEIFEEEEERIENELWPESWKGTQVVGFQFDDPYLPDHYEGNITLINYDGKLISSTAAVNETPTVWVGGITGSTTGYELTATGCEIANMNLTYHTEAIGMYVDSIGDAVDGKEGMWLVYWSDGVYANIAIDAKSIDEDAIVIWGYV